jgi:RND family efflux transporter MFP subunit
MNADLAKAYDDGFSAVSDAFLDLPSIITGLDSLLSEDNISYNKARASGKVASEYRDQVDTLYYEAQKKFETNRDHYRMLDRNSSKADIERVINETYDTAKLLADTIKAAKNLVDYLADYTNSASEFTTASSTLSTYTNTINSHFSNLLFIKTSIKNYKDAFPSTSLDIQSSELSVKQRENALQDAREKLSDYYIRAPFDGVVAKVDVKKLDTVTSSTIVATFITDQKIAEIPLNEVDIAKVKIGQKVDLTFDAIPDLSISGTVAEMDTVGTVDQGVVTYNVKIGFDINDERVKPNMSVSADVVTDTATDVLYVPNSAIKSGKDGYYVEVFGQPLISTGAAFAGIPSKVSPTRKGVEIGLTNNNFTQIVSGLTEGEQVVARIISGTKTATTNSAPSLFGPQTNGRNGGTVRTTPSAR